MTTLSKIVIAYVLVRLEDRFFQAGRIPAAFPGGGLVSALWQFDWSASANPLPPIAFLVGLLLFTKTITSGNEIGGLPGVRMKE
ncbi:hypothetical protein [Bradyrhizobium sp. USDA 10063]